MECRVTDPFVPDKEERKKRNNCEQKPGGGGGGEGESKASLKHPNEATYKGKRPDGKQLECCNELYC